MTAQAIQPAKRFLAVVTLACCTSCASPGHLVRYQSYLFLFQDTRDVQCRAFPSDPHFLGRRIAQRPEHVRSVLLRGEEFVVAGLAQLSATGAGIVGYAQVPVGNSGRAVRIMTTGALQFVIRIQHILIYRAAETTVGCSRLVELSI